ncbi:MAG TPA: hypothetical protein VGR06_00505 [Actinophytocola sp.]|jgi:hypothetical protein|uniref:DUF6817 domain-containing protein n=1 Tax=Actinophytocola sp. TaxID=1872138 RepID=UPI002DF82FDC|nr:hypothetical protein [Actinophytocola sp.]
MTEVEEFLAAHGATGLDHPGGTLLAHLRRTRDTLEAWGARPSLCLAGLAHAAYGTDGFPHPLVDLTGRPALTELIGAEAESIVYTYGSCDRGHSYPLLAAGTPRFRDRFTGTERTPAPAELRDFVELTIANELDVLSHNEDLLAEHGAALHNLFTAWRVHASDQANAAVDGFFP